MCYRLLIIDFDGTLADTLPFMLSVSDVLADRHKLPRLDKSNMQLLKGLNAAKFMKMHRIPFWKVPLLASDLQQMMFENIDQIRLFEGMDKLIRELALNGVRIAVVSSNALRNVRRVLGEELASLIYTFECGVSMFGKAEKLARVLRESGVEARHALSVGDEVRDIEAARAAGIPCAAVTWGFSNRDVLEQYQPNHIFDEAVQISAVF